MMQIHPALARALAERDYSALTPVQEAVLAPAIAEQDLLVSAQTGSGKTVAYGLAAASTLLGEAPVLGRAGAPMMLVVAPTRELALQVERELSWLYRETGARSVTCVGGMDARAERQALQRGAHIVVGTPGRLRDHIERGGLDLSALKIAVLDEADEMLDLGFREDLEFILDAAPRERRTLLFSATLPKPIVALARRYTHDSRRIEVAGSRQGHADIEYRAIRVVPNELDQAVVNLLRAIDSPVSIVFCNTRDAVRRLQAILVERGFAAVVLSGELSQHERNQTMLALRDGRARVCVATDVAARGIDLPNVGLVVHAELPHDAEVLQHRSGRTGRAGRKGISALLVQVSRRRKAELLLSAANIRAEWDGPPTAEQIRAQDRDRLRQDPLLTDAPEAEDLAFGRSLVAALGQDQIAAALVRVYRARLPAIEEVSDPGDRGAGKARFEARERGERHEGRGERPDWRRQDPPQQDRGAKPVSRAFGASVWFKLDVGRSKNADPKWLLPMICRIGGVTKREIGAIRIFDDETRVEIAAESALGFMDAAMKPSDEGILIQPVEGNAAPPGAPPGGHVPAAERAAVFKARARDGAQPGERSSRYRKDSRQDSPWGGKTAGKPGKKPSFARAEGGVPRHQDKPPGPADRAVSGKRPGKSPKTSR